MTRWLLRQLAQALAVAAGVLVLAALALDPRLLLVSVLIVLGLWWASERSA